MRGYTHPEDALAIWAAKRLDFDAGIAIESELPVHVEQLEQARLTPREELLTFYRNDYGTNA